MGTTVKRTQIRFTPNASRIIARFFMPGNEAEVTPIIRYILEMPEEEMLELLSQVLRSFAPRHRSISTVFSRHFMNLVPLIERLGIGVDSLSQERRLLIGAYFTHEYAIEAAALFNPSAVEDPDQRDLEPGQKRVILSFRATGEGHISSIVFRQIVMDADGEISLISPGSFTDQAERVKRHVYDKQDFIAKLHEMEIQKDVVSEIMDRLRDSFIYGELLASIEETLKNKEVSYSRRKVIESMKWLADSHYEITFSRDTALSERVIFPISYSETNGIEDARFVRFVDDDGKVSFYATYTAYNGFTILSKLIKTRDFYHFEVKPLNGDCAKNKGMALFPRKVGGRYAMLSRMDGVNNYIMYSDNINVWNSAVMIQAPSHPWDLVKVGNAGSPIETEHGWLVVTHGIGPVRQYSLGAMLLDIEDPSRVIGSLHDPLLVPNESERNGYVPNVVYSCGSILHNGVLVIPYALSDQISAIATIRLDDLIAAMQKPSTG